MEKNWKKSTYCASKNYRLNNYGYVYCNLSCVIGYSYRLPLQVTIWHNMGIVVFDLKGF